MHPIGMTCITAIVALTLSCSETSWAAAAQPSEDVRFSCLRATADVEGQAGIPRHLLTAISLAESGRWDDRSRASFAWPWTVTAKGEGQFHPTRAAAIRAVRELQAQGLRNIDVGCMQINLMHHADAFATLADAFDPRLNAAYAGKFLREKFADTGSWTRAAGAYHSATPHLNKAYRDKIRRLWRAARRGSKGISPNAIASGNAQQAETSARAPVDPAWTARLNAAGRGGGATNREPRGSSDPGTWQALAAAQTPRRSTSLPSNNVGSSATSKRVGSARRTAEQAAAFTAKRQSQIAQWRQARGGG